MTAKKRLLVGLAVISAAVIVTAWKGTLDWLGLMAVALIFGIPEAKGIVRLYLKSKHDSCDPRP